MPAKKNSSDPRFWRSIRAIEEEIAHQILFAELAFNICRGIPIIPGRGNDLLPYFYNLNFCKGVIALHSILLSTNREEITFRNYFDQYKWEYKHSIDNDLVQKINEQAEKFKKVYEPSLRHKVAAHVSQEFAHTDFTRAYIMPRVLNQLLKITMELKELFFTYTNYSKNDEPFAKIRTQTKKMITDIVSK